MIDLKSVAGDRYRIIVDPSAEFDTDRVSKLWFLRIPCRYGFVSVHGTDTLAAWTGSRKMIARLIEVPGVRVHQRGDAEARVLFHLKQFEVVADLLQARRRRHLSPKARSLATARILASRPDRHSGPDTGSRLRPRKSSR